MPENMWVREWELFIKFFVFLGAIAFLVWLFGVK